MKPTKKQYELALRMAAKYISEIPGIGCECPLWSFKEKCTGSTKDCPSAITAHFLALAADKINGRTR